MYAIVKTGGKQYKVAPGDILEVEKLDVEAGKKVSLETICIVDGKNVEADPAKAAKTKVEAVVLEQFKGEKQLIFKFKRRKNYKRTKGHRQNLTRLQIESVGSEKKAVKPAAEKAASKTESAAKKTTAEAKATTKTAAAKKETTAKAAESKPAASKATDAKKTTAAKKASTAKKTTSAAKTTAEKKTTAAKTPAKKTTTKDADKPATKKAAPKKSADSK